MKRAIWIILTTLWVSFIFYNSTRVGAASSETSGKVVRMVQDILNMIHLNINIDILALIIRKGAHFFEFFLLSVFSYHVMKTIHISNYVQKLYGNISVYSYLIVLGFCLVVAIFDEVIQYFVPGRANSILDVLIDFLGSMFAIFMIVLLNYKKIKSTLNKTEVL